MCDATGEVYAAAVAAMHAVPVVPDACFVFNNMLKISCWIAWLSNAGNSKDTMGVPDLRGNNQLPSLQPVFVWAGLCQQQGLS